MVCWSSLSHIPTSVQLEGHPAWTMTSIPTVASYPYEFPYGQTSIPDKTSKPVQADVLGRL